MLIKPPKKATTSSIIPHILMKSQTMLSKFIKLRERESPNQERLEDAEPSRGKTGPNETN